MAEEDKNIDNELPVDEQGEGQGEALEGGAYEVLKKRLQNLNSGLCDKLVKLNEHRKTIFGGQESKILGNERIQTENNCIPRDIISIGDEIIFGYNVFLGLRSETKLSDVFSVHKFDGQAFQSVEPAILGDETFQRDFHELYKYYKNARFLQFIKNPVRLMLIFQVGETIDDVKIFRFKLDKDNTLEYIDNRGDLDFQAPAQHDFEWTDTTRDDQISGVHPHISIKDQVFVECIEGDLTIKIEDNTETGEGIYSEPVENPDQTLDDASVSYAFVGELILLKILPYREKEYRYFVYNKKRESVVRIDSIERACVQLPEDHGIIFPKGYYLQDGTIKQFEEDVEGMQFLECRKSPNGEDFLYVFYHEEKGLHILIQYNLITKDLANPIFCHGYCLFEDGKMVLFNAPDSEPRRNHPMQIWETTFFSDSFETTAKDDSYLGKIGNRDLVRGISEGYGVSRLISSEHISLFIYQDIIKAAGNMIDGYHWLEHQDSFNIKSDIQEIRTAAIAAVDEYEKVVRIRENTEQQIAENQKGVKLILLDYAADNLQSIDEFVEALNQIRTRRGHVISLRELKYTDNAKVDEMDAQLEEASDAVAKACVEFLLRSDALDPYRAKNKEIDTDLEKVEKIADIKPLSETLEKLAENLDLLTDVVNNLKIDDATKTTRIVDAITDVYAGVNRTRAGIKNMRKDIGKEEAKAEFAAQFKLVSQSVTNYIGMCDSSEKCDEYMTKVMITIEELEGKFADYDEYVAQLTEKREEAYSAFTGRKQVLDEERQRRVTSMISSAERILKGVINRAETFKDVDDINSYFASDLMVSKLRDIIKKLHDAGDSVKADDVTGRLKSAKDEIVRRLRDKLDLFEDGDNVIKFGDYKFSVNTQPLELTTVYRDGEMFFHLTGTDFFEQITDEEFLTTRDLWEQELISEDDNVYRSEYLAYKMLLAAVNNENDLSIAKLHEASAEEKQLEGLVKDYSAGFYNEGYEKGIHDHDATLILTHLVDLYQNSALLRYDSTSRGYAIIFWCFYSNSEHRDNLRNKLKSFGSMHHIFGARELKQDYILEIREVMKQFFVDFEIEIEAAVLSQAAEYLYFELQDQDKLEFTVNALAHELNKRFMSHLQGKRVKDQFLADIKELKSEISRVKLIYDWVSTYVETQEESGTEYLTWEVVALIAAGKTINQDMTSVTTYREVEGILGQHALVEDRLLKIYFDRFLLKMKHFSEVKVPLFNKYVQLRKELIDDAREGMRLAEFMPKVMGSFVRNKLINDVYLNLVGANFAKQMGVVGENKRTDLMGLLLLISPPGYGKTTLMEYISNRLGLTFMKINGPAIGHKVTSLDPAEAPNATAKEELAKLNLSLEMGNNVMIYLDDIQHLNPEFLQKFISLCDAQRKIEGVYKGKTRTYDLRGKKVAVVMAGNPYTESGDKFKIPDMLSNRADTYNLGDISSTAADAFESSFVENAMTSNPTLSAITNHSHEDIYRFMEAAKRGSAEGIDFDYNYSAAEVNDIITVLKKLYMVRDVVLNVNKQYIYSAAQQDDYRTEPSFKMQGSYRNMNRMAEKVFPVMTDDEVNQVILDHYYNEAQTLTTGAESNILKFKELVNRMSDEEQDRWDQIKNEFNRRQSLAGLDDTDEMGKVIAQLSGFNSGMANLRQSVEKGFDRGLKTLADQLVEASAKQSLDVSPLESSLKAIADASAKPGIDLKPLQDSLEKLAVNEGRISFPPEYAEAWNRQQCILETMGAISEKISEHAENYSQLKDLLDKLVKGEITIQLNNR